MTALDNSIFADNSDKSTREPSVDESIKIVTYRQTVRKMEITWSELPHSYFPKQNSAALLQRSDAANDGWETVEELDRFHPPRYLDEDNKATYYRSPIMFYRITFPDVNKVTKVFSTEREPNLYAAEIIRRHNIMLKEGHAGNLMYLFTRMKFQERCPDCWDTIRGTRSKSYCPTCLGTGFVGGYYKPVAIYVSVSPEQNSIQQALDGVVITGDLQCWMSGSPRLQMGDVIVDPNTQDIYHVGAIQLTTHKRVVTKQEFQLQHQDEDMGIMKLFQRIPRDINKKDLRHGEMLY